MTPAVIMEKAKSLEPRPLSTKKAPLATWVDLCVAALLPLIAHLLPLVGMASYTGVSTTLQSTFLVNFSVEPTAFAHFTNHVERNMVFKLARSLALLIIVLFWERRS